MKPLYPFSSRDPEFIFMELDRTSPPIDVRSVAEKLGIAIDQKFTFDRMSLSGEIVVDADGGVKIWVNPAESLPRQRFTLAHELGHYVLHILPELEGGLEPHGFKDGIKSMKRDGSWDVKEYQANTFAASLLMPSFLVAIRFASRKPRVAEEAVIKELARMFDVSVPAMTYRLQNLGLLERAWAAH